MSYPYRPPAPPRSPSSSSSPSSAPPPPPPRRPSPSSTRDRSPPPTSSSSVPSLSPSSPLSPSSSLPKGIPPKQKKQQQQHGTIPQPLVTPPPQPHQPHQPQQQPQQSQQSQQPQQPLLQPIPQIPPHKGKAKPKGTERLLPQRRQKNIERGGRTTMYSTNPTQLFQFSHLKMSGKGKSVGFGEDRQVKSVKPPEWVTMIKSSFFENGKPDLTKLRKQLMEEGRISLDAVKAIIQQAQDIFASENNVLRLSYPVDVIGDLHGQFYDMLNLLDIMGDPLDWSSSSSSSSNLSQFLFLGDYVDRGMFSLEVCLYLFSLKINFPNRIHLLRGNHECRFITNNFNFKIECQKKYSEEVYDLFMDCFDYLPLAATIDNEQGTMLCLHGGLSPYIQTVDEIDEIDRVMEPPEVGAMCDLLWSDPFDERQTDDLEDEEDLLNWYAVDYADNPARGCSWLFGGIAIDEFLANNDLLMLVRGHEVQEAGSFYHYFLREDRGHPMVITIFSAPNYGDIYGNAGGVLRVTRDDYEAIQVEDPVEHPFYLPGFCDAINYTIPFVFEGLGNLCYETLKILQRELEEEERRRIVEGRQKTQQTERELQFQRSKSSEKFAFLGTMIKHSHSQRTKKEEVMKEAKEIESFESVKEKKERWRKAKLKDEINEQHPHAQPVNSRMSSMF